MSSVLVKQTVESGLMSLTILCIPEIDGELTGNIHQSAFLSVHLAQRWCLCQSQTRDASTGQLWQFLDDIRPENE